MDFKEQFRVFLISFNLYVNNENEMNHGTLQKTKADFTFAFFPLGTSFVFQLSPRTQK